jgi:rubrerythrin
MGERDHDQPDRTQARRRWTVRQPIRRRMSVRQAAAELGITVEAVRNRIKRGTLSSEKESGSVFVILEGDYERTDRSTDQPTAGHNQPETGRDQTRGQPRPDDQPAEIVEELRDRIAYLERQVEEEREARRRADTLMARLMDRVPELPAASHEEPRESRETTAEAEAGTEHPERQREPSDGHTAPLVVGSADRKVTEEGHVQRVEGENQDKARKWLQAVELHTCPVCGSDKGVHAGDICIIPTVGPSNDNPVLGVPLTCITCGYLFFFNAMRHWDGSDVSVG